MCGVCGLWHYATGETASTAVLDKMKAELERRGPDDEGTYIDGALGFGFRRLSIVDLAGGHQPMSNARGDIWLVFNGEIYNHNALREELKQRGCQFRTRSDTEVLVYAYQEYGADCVHKLRGMFAFTVWDKQKQQLFAARDRMGIKPYYYQDDGNSFVFASEMKSLRHGLKQKPDLNLNSLERFFTYRYVPGPDSMWQDVHKLPPGHSLIKNAQGLTVKPYWQPDFTPNNDLSVDEITDRTRELLMESTKLRLDADVPVGVLLSGGLDSSTILALSQAQSNTLKTAFSIGFKDSGEFDETISAAETAKHFGIEHNIVRIDAKTIADNLEEFIYLQDEPLADPTGIPLYLICKEAKKTVTVLLSGEGADEVFSGYDRYKMAPVLGSTQSALMSPVRMLSGVANNLFKSGSYAARMSGALAEKHMAWKWHAISSLSSPEFRRELLQPNIDTHAAKDDLLSRLQEKLNPIRSPLDQMQMMDLNTWLPDNMLGKKDRMTMAASIEARVPFLDHKLVEFGLSIPHHLRMHKLTGKWIIRQAMKDMMPAANVNRRKTGWPIPLDDWFRQDMKTLVGDILLGDTTKQRGIYHPKAVQKMLETHWAGKAQYGRQIFLLLCMEMWLRAYH